MPEPTHGRPRRGEPRLPAAVAIVVAVVLYTVLPQALVVGPRYLVPTLEVLLLVPVVAGNPRQLTRESRVLRVLSMVLVLVIGLANTAVLALLVRALVQGGSKASNGTSLLLAAAQVWVTNVIVYGLAYWELDRGGPVRRTQYPREDLPHADFRFSQDEIDGNVVEVAKRSSKRSDWVPTLVDYLYVSCTNSTAFSPTDTMPLSPRAKMLMAAQSVSALVLSLLVIARAVSILK